MQSWVSTEGNVELIMKDGLYVELLLTMQLYVEWLQQGSDFPVSFPLVMYSSQLLVHFSQWLENLLSVLWNNTVCCNIVLFPDLFMGQ